MENKSPPTSRAPIVDDEHFMQNIATARSSLLRIHVDAYGQDEAVGSAVLREI